MSGLRRAEAATRAKAPIVARDLRGLIKVNPIATWSDLDVAGYIADHDVPVNPLVDQGYLSIGCWPCTAAHRARATPARAVGPGATRPSAASTACSPTPPRPIPKLGIFAFGIRTVPRPVCPEPGGRGEWRS